MNSTMIIQAAWELDHMIQKDLLILVVWLIVLSLFIFLFWRLWSGWSKSYWRIKKAKEFLEKCPLPIFAIDNQAKIIMANQAFSLYHPDFNQGEIIGASYKIVTDSANIDYEKSPIVRALQGEEVLNEHSFLMNRHWINNAFPFRNAESNTIEGAMAIYYDITEYENNREKAYKFNRLNLIKQIAAGVAHEIRNPMTVIRGYLQLMMKELGEDYRNHFSIMLDELDRANSIITNFIALARNNPTQKIEQNLNEIILNSYPLIEEKAAEQGTRVELRLAENLPAAYLNQQEIKQLLLNLTWNALEAMEKEGCLTITTRALNGKIQLAVSDTGAGIPSDKLGEIFNPFYTTKDSNAGLGLAVCLSIVELYDGTLDVESQVGVGTTFIVTFPSQAPINGQLVN